MVRLWFRIVVVASALIAGQFLNGQQTGVTIKSDSVWPPGSWSAVELIVNGAANSGPCRLELDFPVGFGFRAADIAGGHLYGAGSSLNIAWSRFPAGRQAIIRIEVMPERSMSGQVLVTGRFYQVNTGNIREVLPVDEIRVMIGGTGRPVPSDTGGGIKAGQTQEQVVFRVQILSSSAMLSEAELKSRLGVSFSEPVTVVTAGNIRKYQAGNCQTYACAEALLGFFSKAGIEGPFIVAWIGGRQVTPDEARRFTGR